jgi:hypothetical protein
MSEFSRETVAEADRIAAELTAEEA